MGFSFNPGKMIKNVVTDPTTIFTGGTTTSKDLYGTDLSITGNSGGSDATSFIPGVGDAQAQDKANKLNLKESQTNRDFQERMSNTAYQRAMADMRKAGLNPTLAYMQGGASAPSGSTATVEAASKTGLAHAAMSAATGIVGAQQKATALQQQQSMNDSAIKLNAANALESAARAQKTRTETRGLSKQAGEGDMWQKVYKGINNVLDSGAKDIMNRKRDYEIKRDKARQKLPAKAWKVLGEETGMFKLPGVH